MNYNNFRVRVRLDAGIGQTLVYRVTPFVGIPREVIRGRVPSLSPDYKMSKLVVLVVVLIFITSCENGSNSMQSNYESQCIYNIHKFGIIKEEFSVAELELIEYNIDELGGSVISRNSEIIQARARCGLNSYDIAGYDITVLVSISEI
ncbi:hypothetical protein [Oceanicaulis sp.]|uniref:hypothetical protein n=1 Tax=Oceanicaulis sp. TaxID=1924941 RepID=UPI003D2E17F1